MFHHTGIRFGDFTENAQVFQQALNGLVPLLGLPCNHQAFGREGNDVMCSNYNIAILLELFQIHGIGWLGYFQRSGKIDWVNRYMLGQTVDMFQVILQTICSL